MKEKPTCSVSGCDTISAGRGWCKKHYSRWERHGDVNICKSVPSPAKDFYREALSFKGDDCLIWPFSRSRDGYAMFVLNGSAMGVSRKVCTETHGEPAEKGQEAAHSCGNGHLGCVNPAHLSWKTRKDNQADRLIHGTDCRGERSGKSKLTNEQVIEIRRISTIRSIDQIAKIFSVHRNTVDAVITRRTWRHI